MSENFNDKTIPRQIKSDERICVMDLNCKREELLATIQHSWYTEDNLITMLPKSDWREANIGILWYVSMYGMNNSVPVNKDCIRRIETASFSLF